MLVLINVYVKIMVLTLSVFGLIFLLPGMMLELITQND